MTLIEVYRIAVAEGLSARQAGERFGVNHRSLAKIRTRYDMPTLRDEWDAKGEAALLRMTDRQLFSYFNVLSSPKNATRYSREYRVCKQLIEKQKNVLGVS